MRTKHELETRPHQTCKGASPTFDPSWQQKAPVPISDYEDFDINVNWTKISGHAATSHDETPYTALTQNSDDSQETNIYHAIV